MVEEIIISKTGLLQFFVHRLTVNNIKTLSEFGQSGAKKGRVSEYRVLQSLAELADSR